MPNQVPVGEINAARRLTDFLSRAYDQYAPPLVKESVKYFNDNPDPIPGFAGDNVVKALMPLVGWKNPRIRELYRNILGFEPIGDVRIAREQFEGPIELTKNPSLISHKSRAGIFVQPKQARGSFSPAAVSARATSPEAYRSLTSTRIPLPLEGTVGITNPIIVPMINKFNNLVREIPLSIFGKRVASNLKLGKARQELEGKLYKSLFDELQIKKTIKGNLEGESLTAPDAIRAALAKKQGFDAVIPLAMNSPGYNRYREVPEVMLIPQGRVGNFNTREYFPESWSSLIDRMSRK